ncbi:MAG TPA: hypothetical protein VFL47_12605, partial [Flavisolibacter sp.]|nr:hypothetical protein [Flavisolibacter sp.]
MFAFFFLLFGATLMTCKKEYSDEGGLSAQYSFTGSPGGCTNATVNGIYTAGDTVAPANTVLLFVNVTRKGSYSISTEKINGMTFSASGNFPDTCTSCSLLLEAHGTPDSAGTFTFHVPGTTGCNFNLTVKDLAAASYSLAGSPGDCSSPATQGTYVVGKSMNQQNLVTMTVNVTTPGKYAISTGPVNGLSFSGAGRWTA